MPTAHAWSKLQGLPQPAELQAGNAEKHRWAQQMHSTGAKHELRENHQQPGLEQAVLGRKAPRLALIYTLDSHLRPLKQRLQEWNSEQVWRLQPEQALS